MSLIGHLQVTVSPADLPEVKDIVQSQSLSSLPNATLNRKPGRLHRLRGQPDLHSPDVGASR